MEENKDVINEEESDVILTDEEGNEYHFTFLDYVDYNEKLYAVFAPSDADLDDEDAELNVFVMEVSVVNDNVSFNLIEDDQIAEGVIEAFYNQAIEEADGEDA